ncbi:MAG: hypothetical protein ACE5JI_04940 [Acidobacteriota bacterium]
MSWKVIGPLMGALLSVLLSSIGVVLSPVLGSDVATSATLIHVAAVVVLLVTILVKLES